MPAADPANDLVPQLAAAWPAERWRDVTVLAAVSGGADSVAMLRGLLHLRMSGEGRLIVAHFNHKLRGAESDADQAFVEELAGKLGLPVLSGAMDANLAAGHGGEGLEGAARNARYDFLTRVADQCGARYVATAHTADDQVETVLFNLLRGTGLAGLAGIPRVRPLTAAATLVRPLLDVTRSEVLAYLDSLSQPYRDDATNRNLDFTRNRIRHELLPLLEEKFNPQVRASLLRTSQIAADADGFLQEKAQLLIRQAKRVIPGGVEIDIQALQEALPLLGRYVLMQVWHSQAWPLQDMNFEKWDGLFSFVCQATATGELTPHMFPGGVRAERAGNLLRLTRPK